jgi:hypothetical protein
VRWVYARLSSNDNTLQHEKIAKFPTKSTIQIGRTVKMIDPAIFENLQMKIDEETGVRDVGPFIFPELEITSPVT